MSDEARNEVATLEGEAGNSAADDEFDDLLPDEGEADLDDDEPGDHELRAGGARRTAEDGNIYWLNVDQLREFNRMDRTIKEDRDFWAWFDAAIKTWDKKPVGKEWRKRGGLSGLWSGGGSSWTGSGKWLSDSWGGSKWFGGSTSDENRKLAISTQAVQTTIRVVDDHERRMTVVLASNEEEGKPSSYTSYDERLIQVSPMALLDDKIEEGEGIDITTGFALHEAGHAQHSEPTVKALRQPTLLRPATVASLLHNILEDVRTEGLTAMDEDSRFPGFAGYLDRSRAYLWKLSEGHRPTTWGPELNDKQNSVIMAGKWYDDYKAEISDPELIEQVEWWHDWVERYHTGGAKARESLIEALERLKSDPDTKEQLDGMEKAEREWEATNGNAETNPEVLKKMVKEMLKKFGMEGFSSCSSGESPGGGVVDVHGKRKAGIGSSDAEEIRRLVQSEVEAAHVKDLKIPSAGTANPLITVMRPPETALSQKRFKPAEPGIVARMRNVFFFRPSAIEEVDRLMRTGGIDEDELWRGGVNDYRMFEQKRIESTPDTSVTLLIDASGSMAGYGGRSTKIQTAIDLAQIMQAVLKDMNGVRTRVRAHTGDNSDSGYKGVAMYKIWDQGDPLTRLSVMNTLDYANNYDGYAIGWCIKEMVDHAKPNEQMVLIVLSDGYPAGSGYGGEMAYKHMRETIAWGEKRGCDTIQIAIQGGMDQHLMFKHFVEFKSTEQLPAQLTALLRKVFPYR